MLPRSKGWFKKLKYKYRGIYSNNYDFVPLPLPSRYRPVTVPLQFLGLRYPRLSCVTDRDTSVTERYKRYRTFQNVTERYKRYRALHTEFMDCGEFEYKKLLNMFATNLLFYLNKFPI